MDLLQNAKELKRKVSILGIRGKAEKYHMLISTNTFLVLLWINFQWSL